MTFKISFAFTLVALFSPVFPSRISSSADTRNIVTYFREFRVRIAATNMPFTLPTKRTRLDSKIKTDESKQSRPANWCFHPRVVSSTTRRSEWRLTWPMRSCCSVLRRPSSREALCLKCVSPRQHLRFPFRAVNYKEAIENLHNQNRRPQRFTRLYQYLVMICEFVVIAWAMTNNATKSPARYANELRVRVGTVIPADIVSILRHACSSVRFMGAMGPCQRWEIVQDRPRLNLNPIYSHRRTKAAKVEPHRETVLSIVLSWWVLIYIACHIIFDALTFSTLIFTSIVISWRVLIYIACHIIFDALTFSTLIFIVVRDALPVTVAIWFRSWFAGPGPNLVFSDSNTGRNVRHMGDRNPIKNVRPCACRAVIQVY